MSIADALRMYGRGLAYDAAATTLRLRLPFGEWDHPLARALERTGMAMRVEAVGAFWGVWGPFHGRPSAQQIRDRMETAAQDLEAGGALRQVIEATAALSELSRRSHRMVITASPRAVALERDARIEAAL